MPSYGETIGEQLQRMRLGPTFVRRGKLPKRPSKPMVPKHHIAIAAGLCGRRDAEICEQPISIPEQVLADRDHRLSLAPRNLTAALQGDPIPGRSALDQRQGALRADA